MEGALGEAELVRAEELLEGFPARRAGTRRLLLAPRACELASALAAHALLAALLGRAVHPVQCTAFVKTPVRNWVVGLHQDLSLPRAALGDGLEDTPEAAPGTRKEGLDFTQPPAAILSELVAVRLHLDPCGGEDGPLRVVPGSHRHGILDPGAALALRATLGEETCLAARGAALVLRPLLLHASAKSTAGRARRALHFLFAPAP